MLVFLLTFAISADTEDLNDRQSNQKDGNPDTDVIFMPEVDGKTGCRDLERKNCQPLDGVIPAHCEAPGTCQ